MESPLNSINEEKESPVLSTSSTLPVIQDKIKIPITKTILFDKWTIFNNISYSVACCIRLKYYLWICSSKG